MTFLTDAELNGATIRSNVDCKLNWIFGHLNLSKNLPILEYPAVQLKITESSYNSPFK